MEVQFPSIKILGSRIHLVDPPGAAAIMGRWIDTYRDGDRCRQIIVTGFHGIWEAYQHADFKHILNTADLWVPDGIAPVWIARLRGYENALRTPGAELMKSFFELADTRGFRSFFYGDTEKTLKGLKERLEADYPGHQVVGTFSPPFRSLTPSEADDIIDMINNASPDVVWVALGLPKQDRWIYEHRARLRAPLAVGVGAAFGFLSGDIRRVPDRVGRLGLEWIWRFLQEPRKLWRRDLIDGPRFIMHVFLELTGLRKYE